MDDVFEACRKQGIRSLHDVELGVLETDGTFSFFTTGPDDDREGAREDHELH
jgi:uncharacterized membrane protein YcaP (DUF421 family)